MSDPESAGREGDAPVLEADLPAPLVAELFAELENAAQIHEIRVQSRRERLSSELARSRLAELRSALVDGTLSGLQIRYRHDGSDWIDTLLRRPQAIRLIRTRLVRVP